ncbi:hypothetical protein GYB61_01090 [bacterium]|nr:hypothetical protein [bacterium]
MGALLLVLIALAYWPGINGNFWLDDYQHIVNQPGVHIDSLSLDALHRAVADSPSSGLGRPLANASFAVNHAISGLQPAPMLATNLAIHIVVAALVFLLAQKISSIAGVSSPWPPLLVTAVWALHPLHVSTVFYVVQRMTALSTLFVLAATLLYLRQRTAASSSWLRTIATLPAIGLLTLLGIACKETAALAPLILLVLEAGVIRHQASGGAPSRILFWCGAVVPSVLLVLALLWKFPDFLAGYLQRDFTMSQRLLTQPLVLGEYLRQLLLPDISSMTLFHDDILPTSSTLPALVLALGVAATIVGLARPSLGIRWLSFGLAFYLVAHALESTFIPLELKYEHRNYLPSTGLFIGLSLQVHQWLAQASSGMRRWAIVLTALAAVTLGMLTHHNASVWADRSDMLNRSLHAHPSSPRAHIYVGSEFVALCHRYINGGLIETARKLCGSATGHFREAAELDPRDAGSLMRIASINWRLNQSVPDQLIEQVAKRLQTAGYQIYTLNSLVSLLSAQPPRQSLPPAVLETWTDAALANDNLPTGAIISIKNAYAQFLFNRVDDSRGAIEIMRQAVDTQPERWDIQFNLLKLLLAAGLEDQALARLSVLEEHPKAGIYDRDLSVIRENLAAGSRQ